MKVYFKDDSFWDSVCDCCEATYMEVFNFSHIEGVDNPEKYQSYDYEMYNGSKHSEWDCLVSVLWDLVIDKSFYKDFYDFCEDFENEDGIIGILLDESVEVIFLED